MTAHSNAGGTGQTPTKFPFDERELARRLRDVELALARSAAATRRVPSKDEAPVRDFGVQPGRHRLAIGSADGTARIWNPATGQQITGPRHGRAVRDMAFNPAASAVRAVAFSPDGTRLATGSADNAARIWAI